MGDASIVNKAIARNTVSHELQYNSDYYAGMPLRTISDRNLLEHRAHFLDLKLSQSQGLLGRYWIESRPNTFVPGQIWFNVFR